jgi:hypothetical protein
MTTTISSDSNDRATRVTKVIFSNDLPEYPETALDGVAYVVNVTHMSTEQVDIMCQNECILNTLIIYY